MKNKNKNKNNTYEHIKQIGVLLSMLVFLLSIFYIFPNSVSASLICGDDYYYEEDGVVYKQLDEAFDSESLNIATLDGSKCIDSTFYFFQFRGYNQYDFYKSHNGVGAPAIYLNPVYWNDTSPSVESTANCGTDIYYESDGNVYKSIDGSSNKIDLGAGDISEGACDCGTGEYYFKRPNDNVIRVNHESDSKSNLGDLGDISTYGPPACLIGGGLVCVYGESECGEDIVLGCTDLGATNYNASANWDNGSCTYPVTQGCTDPDATNYDPDATDNDGSCTYPPTQGCTDPEAINYNPSAVDDNGSCAYQIDLEPPYDLSFVIKNFFSQDYEISDLSFIWSGDTGDSSDPTTVLGSNDNGRFSTQYDDEGEKTVQVYAEYQGERVSETAICDYEISSCGICPEGYSCVNGSCQYAGITASCAAYTSAEAANPTVYFDTGSDVYWRAEVSDTDQALTYNWNDDYDPSFVDGSGGGGDAYRVTGPITVSELGESVANQYDANDSYVTNLRVSDGIGFADSSCAIITKQCNFDIECITLGYVDGTTCDPSTFVCIPPPIIIVEPLKIDPAITNKGSYCGLAWEVDNVDYCDLKKDNETVDLYELGLVDTSTTTEYLELEVEDEDWEAGVLTVTPGTYSLECRQTATQEIMYAGPVKCLFNPDVKEE
ncbi:hypothetical protein N9L18_00400 [Candidatus Pacebacteria bacterium]|nr:hypothetical protein [Candidatus Paceibacterota bacterium]